jgi:hypothetical protein
MIDSSSVENTLVRISIKAFWGIVVAAFLMGSTFTAALIDLRARVDGLEAWRAEAKIISAGRETRISGLETRLAVSERELDRFFSAVTRIEDKLDRVLNDGVPPRKDE